MVTKWKMIKYSAIPESKAAEVAQFLLRNFFVEEPLGKALGLTTSQVERWFPAYIARAVAHSVSVQAVESDTNSLVGVCVCIILDPANPPKTGMADAIDDESEPIMALIARLLSNNWKNNPSPPSEKTLIHQFLSVDTKYAGKGIAKQLIDRVESRAVEFADVHHSQVDTTSHYSYRAYEKRGYEVLLSTEYTSIEDGGVRPLESKVDKLGIHTHVRLLSKTF